MRFGATAWVLALVAAVCGQSLLAQDAGLFVAVGYEGRCVISRDGMTWEERSRLGEGEARKQDGPLLDIAHGAGRFVAVGGGEHSGRVFSSADGVQWQALQGVEQQVSTIAFGNGRFVACGGGGLMASKDGQAFQAGQRFEWNGKVFPRRSACGDTEAGFRFVIIGELETAGSSTRAFWRGVTGDGESWDHTALDTVPVNDIAYGAGNFVAVGPDGLIESSHDGQTWVRRSSAPGEELRRVVWTGKRFLVSSLQSAWSSPDGFVWAKEAPALPCDVIWAREEKLGIGLSLIGELCVSSDLANWKKVTLPAGPPLCAVAVKAGEGR